MATKRERAIQLRAYAKWNPENDPDKVSDLEQLITGAEEGRLVIFGRAVVERSLSYDDSDELATRFEGAKIGRALIGSKVTIIGPDVVIGDESVITGTTRLGSGAWVENSRINDSNIEDDAIVDNSDIDNSAVSESFVHDSRICLQDINNGSTIRNSTLVYGSGSTNSRIKVFNSFVDNSKLSNTPMDSATLDQVIGSSGGRMIEGGPFKNMTMTSIGDDVLHINQHQPSI